MKRPARKPRSLTNADIPSGAVGDADWDDAWDALWDTADPAAMPGVRHRRGTSWGVWTACWGGLAVILVAGSYAGSAWLAADGMLHALGRRDSAYMIAHLDAARLLGGLEQDLRHMAAQSTAGRAGTRPREAAYLDRLAHGTSVALHDPDMLGLVIQARILDPMSGTEAMDFLDNGPRHLVADSLTAFHVAIDADSRSLSGLTLCFSLENLRKLDWRLVQVGWPEMGGRCG